MCVCRSRWVLQHCYLALETECYIVEPPNKGHFGDNVKLNNLTISEGFYFFDRTYFVHCPSNKIIVVCITARGGE